MLSTMPGVLIENGFHDNPTDVEAMKDPRFLQLSARAIYHGLVNYWHAIDPNVPLVYLPEPPQQVTMRNTGGGQITIEWQPGPTDGSGPLGDAATSYRVYTSTDGFGWSNPIDVSVDVLHADRPAAQSIDLRQSHRRQRGRRIVRLAGAGRACRRTSGKRTC